MPSLVTGATGLVGFHIVEALLRSGDQPRVLVRNLERARALFGERAELVKGDVTDEASVIAALPNVDTVFHAAGHPEQWMKDNSVFELVNVGGTRTVVQACRQAGVRRLVYTGTIDVFEAHFGERFNEDVLATQPKGTPYQRSKQVADRVVTEALKEGLDAVFVHPAAVYGPGPSRSRGINDFVKDLQAGKVPVLLPGGMPVVFASDVGEAHVRAAQRASTGERFILSERFVTLQDLAIAANVVLGLRRIPTVVPLMVARAISAITEAAARLTGNPPLVPAGQLHFLQGGAIPDAQRARQQLDMKFTTLEVGLAALVASW